MRNRPRRRDWEILGLDPGSDLALVKRAYRRRRSLYDGESLATYTLLDSDERKKIQAQIDAAYRRIVGEEPSFLQPDAATGTNSEGAGEMPAGPPPDPLREPGAHLRYHRLHQGLVLREIAAETRISPVVLAKIENGDSEGLPAPVFVRGFVLQFARVLGLPDADVLANAFLETMED